jgi:glycosyltransferase involved in cell wall biosynthesis
MRLVVVSHPCITPANQDFYARVQARTEWEVTILMPSRWKNEYGHLRPSRWPTFRGDLVELPVALAGNIPLHVYLARLHRRLRDLRPDVLYVHNEPYAAATFQVVRAARDLDKTTIGFYSAQNLNKHYGWPVSQMERWVYARTNFAFPVSREVADVLQSKGYRGVAEVLPLPVDTERFHPHSELARDNSRPFTAGYVGRLAEEKGVDTLLEALGLLKSKDLRLLVVGDGPAREALASKAGEIGVGERITWAGYVPHDSVEAAYREMDVLVVPSKTVANWKEQFGRVVVEALACGVPVIASDSGGLPTLMNETGGGWLFGEGDARQLADILDAVREGADTTSRTVATRGREAVRRLFDADAVAQQFASVCERVRA